MDSFFGSSQGTVRCTKGHTATIGCQSASRTTSLGADVAVPLVLNLTVLRTGPGGLVSSGEKHMKVGFGLMRAVTCLKKMNHDKSQVPLSCHQDQ